MHNNRRRKKRPSYGVRTVEITKGKNGFGFTISGQAPCILSCIVPGSPAERAGLRPGDYLIAVNGQNVSKAPHDDVARLIGLSKLLKLQIAENYYSDSSDDEFVAVTRPKPKYPNRLRHKNQQTRAEKVAREVHQNGAIFSEHTAIHLVEAALLSDRDAWPDSAFPPKAPLTPTPKGLTVSASVSPIPEGLSGGSGDGVPQIIAPSTSPTRLRPDQIHLVMAEARQATRTPRPMKEPQQQQQPPRPRHVLKKKDKSPKGKLRSSPHSLSPETVQQQQLSHQHQHLQQHLHQPMQQSQQQNQQPQRQQSPVQQHKGMWVGVERPGGSTTEGHKNGLTEQEINKLLYPTLAELQQQAIPNDIAEALYRAVVGYLGTIEMPKEPQSGSRLTAIGNCIRRLRIEKKVHTLVLMSVFQERVVLTSPHGLTLAQYPAERIAFCGVYADDKKFFGLVTVHGASGDELSDGSQDGRSESASCHVFMVDPRMVQHGDHARRAKSFRLECTPNPEAPPHCQEFPDSVEPIVLVIMSLYRHRVGFHLDTGAPGLINVEAQMSPQHSNTSSNSSNSDSGIGFRDDGGGHHYHHNDRGFVVEVDDNHRMRIQNFPLVGNLRGNLNDMENHRIPLDPHRGLDNHRVNIDNVARTSRLLDNARANIDNLRANIDNHRLSNTDNFRVNIENHRLHLDNLRSNMTTGYSNNGSVTLGEIFNSSSSANNLRAIVNDKLHLSEAKSAKLLDNVRANVNDHLRVSVTDKALGNADNLRVGVSDTKCLNDLRASIAESRASLVDGRTSITDDLRVALEDDMRNHMVDGRTSINDDMRVARDRGATKTPVGECGTPETGRLTVRAMPDPVGFERSPGCSAPADSPVHVASMRHSMHKYLQHKQEHLVKVSQKINRRESDTGGIHPLSVRAFSPSTTKAAPPTPSICASAQEKLDLELSLKLSPKVYGMPQLPLGASLSPLRPRAPSERSFTRSLEDLRDSSTSDGVTGPLGGGGGGGGGGSFRDGSESDHGLDRLRHIPLTPLARLLHASENNLTRYGHVYPGEHHRGAFRAVPPRALRDPPGHPLGGLVGVGVPLDSGDEHTETTGEQEGSQDVHPPTQDEFSHDSDSEQVEGSSEKKWARSNSLRRPFHRGRDSSGGRGHHRRQDPPSAHSDTEIGKISAPHSLLDGEGGSGRGSVTSERAIDVGRVSAWAASFEKLLEDPAGLHTFAEFLKKEYSHENIYFWTACERYKRLSSPDELQAMAKVIAERHLCIGASEPVNVDSQARQDAQDSLHNPNEFLFYEAQKQIFNLMKFDSYSRFLKSNLYQDCLARDMRGQTLPYPGDDTMDPDLKIIQDDSHVALKKSKSDVEERRRKSLLPWHRKDRSKSKDRGESEYRRQKKSSLRNNQSDSSSIRSDMSGSRTSLNSSSDMALGRRAVSKESLTSGDLGSLSGSEGYHRCRVILPDLSNSVVAVRHGETVQVLLTRLLERRGISFSAFEVYHSKKDKLIDKNEDSVILGGLEVRIERRILFRLDLPNRKTVCIKSRPNKLTADVLRPILLKYNYKPDLMCIYRVGNDEKTMLNMKCPITEIDGIRLVVQMRDEMKGGPSSSTEWGGGGIMEPGGGRHKKKKKKKHQRGANTGNALDEITNKVFEDLLKGKSTEQQHNFDDDDLGIWDFDARSSRSEHSSDRSSVTGGYGIRNSTPSEKDTTKQLKPPNRPGIHEGLGAPRGISPSEHPLVTKRRGLGGNTTPNPNDELYEGLKRAQRSRLDDQRGTEINFELPDFLKCDDDEGDQSEDKENQRTLLAQLESSFSEAGIIPSHQEAEDYFSMAHPEVWGGPHSGNATLVAPPDLDLDEFDNTLVGDDSPSKVPMPENANTSLHLDAPDFSPPPPIPMEKLVVPRMIPAAATAAALQMSPPPLPPKPKVGGTRGPPPRPPSRSQLLSFNPPAFPSTAATASDEDALLLHSTDPPIHRGRQSISFV